MENCKLCNDPTENLVKQVEDSVIEMIKNNYPNWVESDGTCKKCISYYKNLDQLIEQND